MEHMIFYFFLILSILPGLCFAVIPLCVRRHKQKKYSLKVQAEIINRHWFTWLDNDFRSHPGVQLAYRYNAGNGIQTRRGRALHNVKEIPTDNFVTLHVNPKNTDDIWEDRDKQGLYISIAVGLIMMLAGVAAVIVYFCM